MSEFPVGKAVRIARQVSGMKARELAAEAKMTPSMISMLEAYLVQMANDVDKKTLPQQEEAVEMSKTALSIPAALHKELRFAAVELNMSQQDIYAEAVREWLGRYHAGRRGKLRAAVETIAHEAVAKHAEPPQQEE